MPSCNEEKIEFEVPMDLYEKLVARSKELEYESVDEYVEDILNEFIEEIKEHPEAIAEFMRKECDEG